MAFYGIDYWLRKGLSQSDAALRAQGKSRCVICDRVTDRVFRSGNRQTICSDDCRLVSEQRRIEKYKETCSVRHKCDICSRPMAKKNSLHQIYYICSLECQKVRRDDLPKTESQLNTSYWVRKGLTESEAVEAVSEIQKKRSPASPSYYLKRGSEEAEAIELARSHQIQTSAKVMTSTTPEQRRIKSVFCIEYWMAQGYSEEAANSIISDRHFSANQAGFIKRYGKGDGERKYQKFCAIMTKVNNLRYYIELHGEDEGTKRWAERYRNTGGSKFAEMLFTTALQHLKLPDTINVYFQTEGNREFGRASPDGKYYFYDFVIPSLALCIELHGAFWHADPKKYKSGDAISHNHRLILVDDVWEKDRKKQELLEMNGYTYVVLWFRKRNEWITLLLKTIAIIERQCVLHGIEYEKISSN